MRTTIDLPAGTIHYRVSGPEDGPPMVFVHGFLVDDTLWADVPERVAEAGFRTYAPTWPLASQPTPMKPDAELSPRAVARIILSFLEALDLRDVVLVGNDTGGAVCQFLLDEDASRIGRLVLTNCDAFDTFPPFPFNLLFRLGRHPIATKVALQPMRWSAVARGPLGFGPLTKRPITAAGDRALAAPGAHREGGTPRHGPIPEGLELEGPRGRGDAPGPKFDRPVLIAWAPEDRFFKIALGERLATTFPDARLVRIPDAGTFVALDQPERLAAEIVSFVGGTSG